MTWYVVVILIAIAVAWIVIVIRSVVRSYRAEQHRVDTRVRLEELRLEELRAFSDIGGTFTFRGKVLLTISHYQVDGIGRRRPALVCLYLDRTERFRRLVLETSLLPALRRENGLPPYEWDQS